MSESFDRPPVGQRPTREERDKGKRKVFGSTLKASTEKPRRYTDSDDMGELVEKVAKRDNFICVGHRLGYDHECHSSKEALHLVDQKHLGRNHPALTDPDICVYGCRLLNNWLDEWHGPLVNVRERRRLRDLAGETFEVAVHKYGIQAAADRKFNGAS
jgi:hypothetical protein